MTIICALSDGGNTWIGSNSGITFGDLRWEEDDSKWIGFSHWKLGLTGRSIVGDILKDSKPRFRNIKTSPLKFASKMREVLYDHDAGTKDSNDATNSFDASGILVHVSGRIWDMDSFLALAEIQTGTLWARGSGMEYALGADHAGVTVDPSISSQTRIRLAVEAAIKFDAGCPGKALLEKVG